MISLEIRPVLILDFLPSTAIKGLDLVEINLEQSPDKFDVIAAWLP